MKTKRIILFSAVLLCIISGILAFTGKKTTETKIIYKESCPQKISFITFFEKCGHTKTFVSKGEKTYSTEEEVKKDYPGYEIKSFSSEKITLKKTIDSYCPSHYLAKLNGKNIVISNVNSGKIIYVFSYNEEKMTDEENKRLIEGIEFLSKEAMLSFMEDYTS